MYLWCYGAIEGSLKPLYTQKKFAKIALLGVQQLVTEVVPFQKVHICSLFIPKGCILAVLGKVTFKSNALQYCVTP